MAAAPAKPPEEVPAEIKEDVAKLQKLLAAILVGKEIPWVIQAALGASGYVCASCRQYGWLVRGGNQGDHPGHAGPTKAPLEVLCGDNKRQ